MIRMPAWLALTMVACSLGLAPLRAEAGLVHLSIAKRGGTEYGAGYTVGRGGDCFVVTAFHVVELAPADGIAVTDAKGSRAKARVVKGSEEFDAGLLQVESPHTLDCPADWSDGATAVAAIGAAPFLVARKVDDAGRVVQTRLFAASTSREQIVLAPYGPTDTVREGDSGSALYAGDQLVGLLVAVDTRSGQATAITQSQIHGLFGVDVLPSARLAVSLQPFTYRRAENPYATIAAREWLEGNGQIVLAAAGGAAAGADYVIQGQIVDVTSTRAANPHYEAPTRASNNEGLGTQLLRNLGRRVNEEFNEALDRNINARYLRTYNVDVQIEITKVADGSKSTSLERRSFEMAEDGTAVPDLEKTAIGNAVREALALTLAKHPL